MVDQSKHVRPFRQNSLGESVMHARPLLLPLSHNPYTVRMHVPQSWVDNLDYWEALGTTPSSPTYILESRVRIQGGFKDVPGGFPKSDLLGVSHCGSYTCSSTTIFGSML